MPGRADCVTKMLPTLQNKEQKEDTRHKTGAVTARALGVHRTTSPPHLPPLYNLTGAPGRLGQRSTRGLTSGS